MRKAVVSSNCQAGGLGRAFGLLMPDWDVVTVAYPQLLDPATRPAMIDLYRSADLVLTLDWPDHFGEFSAARVRELNQRVIFVPAFEFAGFHPDCTYILTADGKALQTPLTDYNSIIAAAGYLAGVSPARLPALYNAYTFAKLGYFDLPAASKLATLEQFSRHGLDIAPLFDAWERRGSFMHSVNHPKIWVLVDIARLVCEQHDLGRIEDVPYAELLFDELANGPVYPVFPEIARRLEVPGGSRYFKTMPTPSAPRERLLHLRDFVAASCATYADSDRTKWHVPPRVRMAAELFAQYAG